jgi:hypothetical protein
MNTPTVLLTLTYKKNNLVLRKAVSPGDSFF